MTNRAQYMKTILGHITNVSVVIVYNTKISIDRLQLYQYNKLCPRKTRIQPRLLRSRDRPSSSTMANGILTRAYENNFKPAEEALSNLNLCIHSQKSIWIVSADTKTDGLTAKTRVLENIQPIIHY